MRAVGDRDVSRPPAGLMMRCAAPVGRMRSSAGVRRGCSQPDRRDEGVDRRAGNAMNVDHRLLERASRRTARATGSRVRPLQTGSCQSWVRGRHAFKRSLYRRGTLFHHPAHQPGEVVDSGTCGGAGFCPGARAHDGLHVRLLSSGEAEDVLAKIALQLRRAMERRRSLGEPDPAAACVLASALALECGFGDVSNFNRAFRSEFGVTPREYARLAAPAGAR